METVFLLRLSSQMYSFVIKTLIVLYDHNLGSDRIYYQVNKLSFPAVKWRFQLQECMLQRLVLNKAYVR